MFQKGSNVNSEAVLNKLYEHEDFLRRFEEIVTRERIFREEFSHGLMREMRDYIDARLRKLIQAIPQSYPIDGTMYMHSNDGHRLFLDARETFMSLHVMEHGEWESHLRALMRCVLKPGDVYVDVGANIGLHTLYGAQLVGDTGRVLALEAHPRTYQLLMQNIDINGYGKVVEAQALAVADQDGQTIPFHYYPTHPGMSGFVLADWRLAEHKGTLEPIDVRTITLDTLLASDYRADLIKIDVEGFEPTVMRGATQLLASQRDACFVLEIIPKLTASVLSNQALTQMLDQFAQGGYHAYALAPEGRLHQVAYDQPEAWQIPDICFVHPKSRHYEALRCLQS